MAKSSQLRSEILKMSDFCPISVLEPSLESWKLILEFFLHTQPRGSSVRARKTSLQLDRMSRSSGISIRVRKSSTQISNMKSLEFLSTVHLNRERNPQPIPSILFGMQSSNPLTLPYHHYQNTSMIQSTKIKFSVKKYLYREYWIMNVPRMSLLRIRKLPGLQRHLIPAY